MCPTITDAGSVHGFRLGSQTASSLSLKRQPLTWLSKFALMIILPRVLSCSFCSPPRIGGNAGQESAKRSVNIFSKNVALQFPK